MKQNNKTIPQAVINNWWSNLSYNERVSLVEKYSYLLVEQFTKIKNFCYTSIENIYNAEHPEQAMDLKKIKEDSEDLQALVSAEMHEQAIKEVDEMNGVKGDRIDLLMAGMDEVDNSKEVFKKGEWTIGENRIKDYIDRLDKYRKGHICINSTLHSEFAIVYRHEIEESDAECEATARLIAAAPDMYRALKNMCEWHEKQATWDKGDNGYYKAKAILNRIDNK